MRKIVTLSRFVAVDLAGPKSITVAAHTNNLAVVTTTWKQMAKQYCIKLQKFGLTSSIAPGGGGEGEDGGAGPETQ